MTSERTIIDSCPHCGVELSHAVQNFDGEQAFTCGSCGRDYYCTRYTPYPTVTLYILGKTSVKPGARTLERLPSDEEWDDMQLEDLVG
jgi:transposase-like protein